MSEVSLGKAGGHCQMPKVKMKKGMADAKYILVVRRFIY